MAIKITGKLVHEVKEHISTMRDAAIKAEFGTSNDEIPFYPSHEDLEAMDALFWGEHLHLKSKIPAKWCDVVESKPGHHSEHSIKFDLAHKGKTLRFSLELDTKGVKYLAPPNEFPYSYALIPVKRGVHAKLDELYDSLVKRADVVLKWIEIESKVVSVLRAAISLNQAAKAWPEVTHFLPEDRKEQYKKDIAPKVRVKRDISELEAAIGGIDKDAMAGELVAFRFATNS